jgi:ribose transport system permease protein
MTAMRSATVALRAPWTLNFVAALLIWGLTLVAAGGRGGAETLTVALAFSVFTVLAGTGQMFVIAAGPGNIDLSIPAVMTLAAYLSMGVMDGDATLLPLGLAIALGTGVLAGVGNIILIRALKIPPIIATLALSFMLQSLANNAGGEATIKPPQMLADFTILKLGGVQILLVLVLVLSAFVQLVIARSVFGRYLLAVGQNDRAAALTGIPVWWIRLGCYCLCGAMAGLTGFLLAGFSGGAMLNMGGTYLMESVAVVVLGGTAVAGGRANAIGIWGAALFFNLLTTMINAFHLAEGWRFICTGAVILFVISLNPDEPR